MEQSFRMSDEQFKKFVFDCLIDLFAAVNAYGEIARRTRAEQRGIYEDQMIAELQEGKEKYRNDLMAHFLTRYAQ